MMTKGRFFLFCTLILVASTLSACGANASTQISPTNTPQPAAPPTSPPLSGLEKLIADAQAEGTLTTMALPHDWCNYGEMIETYKSKYGMQVNELNPNAGSGEEIEAIKNTQGSTGPDAPDVIDVGFAYSPQLVDEKLTLPYQVATWDTLPAELSHPDGIWTGNYYGVLAFEVNTDLVKNVPQDWADLLKPEYKGQVALAGDPKVSSQAIMSVFAAALANGGSRENVMPGVEFFKELNEAGNFVPVIARRETLVSGQTPIIIRWDYNALADKQALAGNPNIEIVVPKTGVIAGVYVSAISAYAPHPNAAKLWMEFLYSDEGQLIWLSGGCHPVRYMDLVRRKAIPAEILPNLPPAEPYAQAVFPTVVQLDAAKQTIVENWDSLVGVEVK